MEWYENWKSYAVLAIALPVLLIIPVIITSDGSFLGWFMPVMVLFVMFPCICMMLYVWVTGKGKRLINGFDWSKYTEEQSESICRRLGRDMTVLAIVITYGIAVIPSYVVPGLILTLAACALMVVDCIVLMVKPPLGPPRRMGKTAAMLTVIAVALIAAVGPAFISSAHQAERVDVTVGDSSFSVKAPGFDHTFAYSDITAIQYEEDFEKGTRIYGYATDTLRSGRFHNSIFGDYDLASYTKISPCIVISAGGNMYAFNQQSVSDTHSLYDQLYAKVNP